MKKKELKQRIAELEAENAQLQARVIELERNQNSSRIWVPVIWIERQNRNPLDPPVVTCGETTNNASGVISIYVNGKKWH